jgi:hypothetical protein
VRQPPTDNSSIDFSVSLSLYLFIFSMAYNMVSPSVILATTTAFSWKYMSLFPTSVPSQTDPWYSAAENITQYFDFQTPTGALATAIFSHGKELMKTCTHKGLDQLYSCAQPDKSRWCEFSASAPTSVLSAYSSYGGAAASWWALHSSAIMSVATVCPKSWQWYAKIPNQSWLNATINLGECY